MISPNKNKITQIKKIIKRCKQTPEYFIDSFCKIKHPNAGIIPFHLFSYQRNCLQNFTKNRFNIFSKTRQCFVAGSMVWTPNGPTPIEEINIGDEIYTFNIENNSLETTKVSNTFDNNIKETIEVRSKSGHRSVCTLDHRFLTTNGWVEAKDLTQNDILVEINDSQRYVRANKSEAILLGYLITDGYYGNKDKAIHFTNTTWKYLLEFQKHFELKFGIKLPIKKHNWNGKRRKKDAYRLYSYDKNAKQWLDDLGILGQKSSTKIIPKEVFKWHNDSIAILLNRMFAGDGWYSGAGENGSNEAGIGSESYTMLCQIKQLLTRFNIDSKIYKKSKTSMNKLRIIGGKSFNNFANYIGIHNKNPRRKLTQGFIKNRIKGQVLSIKQLSEERVYDLEVPPHNNFIVDGVVVHNSGISTLCGAYALWISMMFKNKTVLIVSKRDKDAMEFMSRNIKFVYNYLPKWMQAIWFTTTDNEHEIGFSNGSKITSLPSGAETLRSNSSSLNIIDEAAFCPHMNDMWSGGYPTLQHGGSVIVVSTSHGIGDWYWKTWTDSQDSSNEFNPIAIDWWDMDWSIEYEDDVSKQLIRIAPTDGIRPCKDKDEIAKYGKYWSPWLETQRRQLTEKGNDSKFRQEVLRDFLGSGNTVLSRDTLTMMRSQAQEAGKNYKTVNHVDYVQPINGESYHLDFQDKLWIWNEPETDHIYAMGADISSGEANDWSAIQIFNIVTGEQVAELQIKAKPKIFSIMVDYVGRWYNSAFLVPERTGMGVTVCQDLEEFAYPNIFRKGMLPSASKRPLSGQNNGPIGYNTTGVGKPILNKAMIDNLGENGYKIKSHRLVMQAETYIHLGANRTGAEKGTSNDDLIIAAGLSFVGVNLAASRNNCSLVPFNANVSYGKPGENREPILTNDFSAICPTSVGKDKMPNQTQEEEMIRFSQSLICPIMDSQIPNVSKKKHSL